jgi:hypothetical protein
MSSSGGERFTIGAHVHATDGRCGHLIRVILDPVANSLTHLVVQPGHHQERARLVPVDLVEGAERKLIRLNCTKDQFEQLDAAEDVQLVPGDSTGYGDAGIGLPYYYGQSNHAEAVFTDRVPPGEVEMSGGDAVHAQDGWIGEVQGLVIDPVDHHVTHLILKEGHVWGHKQVAIPIGATNRVAGEIRVDLTMDEIEALPPVSLSSRR